MLLLPGILGFCLFIVFDLNKIRWHRPLLNCFFALGAMLLILSTILCLMQTAGEFRLSCFSAFMLAALTASCGALIYALFFALPFDDTYKQSKSLPLVTAGIYGLCRHPGFWPFLLIYFFLWLSFGGKWLMWAMLVFPLCNLIYIIIQDKYIFPLYIEGYDSYKLAVPFLIPRRKR